ncbi:MAG: hypothetical protein LBC72_01475 [Spirochaetaceae bacterium]|nr:hypothetical protein [Spirochaetaceae bacterium]
MFLEWLLRLFSPSRANTPDKNKRILLRRIARDIKKTPFQRFYFAPAKMLMPQFASFFYTIYIYIGPYAKNSNIAISPALKKGIVDFFLNAAQKEILYKISSENLKEQSLKLSPKLLREELIKNMDTARKIFTPAWLDNINYYYNLIIAFSWIITFDYYPMLKCFYPNLKENDFFSKTFFTKLRATVVLESIKDFLAIAVNINSKQNWHIVFDILGSIYIKKMDFDNWIHIVHCIERIWASRVLEKIVKHAEDNPFWENTPVYSRENIASKYLGELLGRASMDVDKILEENKNEYIDVILRELYGDGYKAQNVSRYNSEESLVYENHGFNGFIYADKLNHTTAFLVLFFDNIKRICDIFIIHGEWAVRERCAALNDAMNVLTNNFVALKTFNRNAAADGSFIATAREYLEKIAQDRRFRDSLHKHIADINFAAGNLTTNISAALSTIDDIIKALNQEKIARKLTLLINWNSIESSLDAMEFNLGVCEKKISDFLLLINRNASAKGPEMGKA